MTLRQLSEMSLNDLRRLAVRCQTAISLDKSDVWLAQSNREKYAAEERLAESRELARKVLAEIAHKEQLAQRQSNREPQARN